MHDPHQRGADREGEQDGYARHDAEPARLAGTDRLCAEHGGSHPNRLQRRKHISDDLIDRPIGGGRAGAERVDERDDRHLRQRHHGELQAGRHADRQKRPGDPRVYPQSAEQFPIGRQRMAPLPQIDRKRRERDRTSHEIGQRRTPHTERRQSDPALNQRRRQQ